MKFSMNEVLTALRANGLHDEAAAVGIVLQQRAELLEVLKELSDLMDDVRSGNYEPDSFTTQPARTAISRAEK